MHADDNKQIVKSLWLIDVIWRHRFGSTLGNCTLFSDAISCAIAIAQQLSSPTSNGLMMTSSNGNIFLVTGHLCGEFTDSQHRGQWRGALVFWCLNKPLSKQSWGWWFETPTRSSWRHCNVIYISSVACSVPSHYLNQWCVISNWTLGNKFQWNVNQNTKIFVQENSFGSVVFNKANLRDLIAATGLVILLKLDSDKSSIFQLVWPWNLMDDLEKQ